MLGQGPGIAGAVAKAGDCAQRLGVGQVKVRAVNCLGLFQARLTIGGLCSVKIRFKMRTITKRFIFLLAATAKGVIF